MKKVDFEDIVAKFLGLKCEGLNTASMFEPFKICYTEKLLDFFRAEHIGDKSKMIDALCDMTIIAMNSGRKMCFDVDNYSNISKTAQNLTYPLYFGDCVHCILYEIKKMGYNPYLCLLEKMRELESMICEDDSEEDEIVGAHSLEEAEWKLSEEFLCSYYKCIREDDEYWYFHPNFHENDDSDMIKIKKWYKPDYERCGANHPTETFCREQKDALCQIF